MKFLLVLLLSINTIFAQDIVPIKKGQPSPADGFYISYNQEKKFRLINEENLKLKTQVIQLKDLSAALEDKNTILEQRLTLYQNQNKYLTSELSDQRIDNFFGKTIYFIGGILVTGAIGYIALKYGNK